MSTVYVELSAPQQHATSAMPKALHDLYYGGKVGDELLKLIQFNGYPHHGGSHALTIIGERYDTVAWLDLFLEHYPETKPEIDVIKKEIRKIFLRDPSKSRVFIKLQDFTRQHGYKGDLITRRWFWHEQDEPDYVGE